METRPKVLMIDLDGTLFEYDLEVIFGRKWPTVLPGTLEKLKEWREKGYYLVITTGRDEDKREWTDVSLRRLGISYHAMIMGIGGGIRHLINDRKPDGEDTAIAINLDRNQGISLVNL